MDRVGGCLFKHSMWRGVVLAVVLTAAVVGLRLVFEHFIGNEAPFLMMMLLPIIAAWYGGMGSGLIATVLAAAAGEYFFLAPRYSFRLPETRGIVQLALFAVEGSVVAVWAASRDRAQEAVREAAAQKAEILESISDAFIALDRNFRFTYVNAAAENLLNMRAEDLIGRDHWEVFPMVVGQPLEREYRRAMAERVPVELEYHHTPSGRWTGIRLYPSGDGGLSIFFRDITERKEQENQVHQLAAIVESSDDGILSMSLDGTILTWNRGAERIYGYSEAEVVGKSVAMLIPPDLESTWPQILGQLREGQEVRRLETVRMRKSGERFPVSLTVSAICDAEGRTIGASTIARDISERMRLEESVREAQKLESLGVLAGGIAHDFNNLLTGIVGNASLAMEVLPQEHPARGSLQNVLGASERAAELTRQMLAYSGKGRFVMQPVDLSALVQGVAGLIGNSVPATVRVAMKLSRNLPQVMADPGQMEQLIVNLAINAGEAIGEETGTVTVATGACTLDEQAVRNEFPNDQLRPGAYVWLEVKDTGCGMDEQTLTRIFDPFFSTKFTGRGLGLAAVSGIVRGHHGALSVASSPGKGSTFRVLLPAATAKIVKPAAAVPCGCRARAVLVVDGEEIVRHTAERALASAGYEVLAAGSAQQAVQLFREHACEVGLILLDMNLRDMAGAEALENIRSVRPEVPVVVSSGYTEPDAARRFSGQHVDGFLQKPYTPAALEEKVARLF